MNRIFQIFVRLMLLVVMLGPVCSYAGLVLENGMTEERNMQPGETYQGSIPIRNTGTTPIEIKIYQTDYAFNADGYNNYGPPGKLTRSNAGWLRLNREQFTIPAGDQILIDYTLQVPNDAALAGTYWSMLMVEPIAPGSPEASALGSNEMIRAQVVQVLRYGIQFVTQISDSGAGELTFENLKLLNNDGQRLFSVDLKNVGERWVNPQLYIELYDTQGQPVGKLDGERKRLYPDTSARFQIPLINIDSGKYVALVVADGGGDDLFGTQIELDIH
jgi:hypothetical protein